MRWTDARNGAPGIAEFVGRLSAFLVLVGLSGLAVGGIGVSAAVRAYLSQKTETIATLRTLGADKATIFQTYMIQIGVLSGIGILLGLALGGLLPLLLALLLLAVAWPCMKHFASASATGEVPADVQAEPRLAMEDSIEAAATTPAAAAASTQGKVAAAGGAAAAHHHLVAAV